MTVQVSTESRLFFRRIVVFAVRFRFGVFCALVVLPVSDQTVRHVVGSATQQRVLVVGAVFADQMPPFGQRAVRAVRVIARRQVLVHRHAESGRRSAEENQKQSMV